MLNLSAKIRQETGRKNNAVREKKMIPAVLYGHKIKNLNLIVDEDEFKKIYQQSGESTLIKLNLNEKENKKDRVVLIYGIQKNPVNDRIIHIDFYQVKMDQKISVEVPLVFVGQSDAVERDKGVLIKNIQVVEVEALPQNLPSEIEVDISVLKTFDDNIYIKDLKIPENAEIKNNPEDSVASVIPPRTQEELEDLEETPVEEEAPEEEKKESSEEKEEVQEGGQPAEEESVSGGKKDE